MPAQPIPASPPRLFDRALVARRAARAWTGTPNFVAELVNADLKDRLAPIQRRFDKPALIGPDGRALPTTLGTAANGPVARFSSLVASDDAPLVDPEMLVLPAGDYDLIVSLLDIQIVNDVPGFLARLRRHLRPDGLLLAAALGGQSLAELRAAWIRADIDHLGGTIARVAPFMDVRDAGALLQRAGFALPVTDGESHIVRYADPLALMRELRALGATNPLADRSTRPVTRGHLARALAAYPADADGRVPLTLEIIWMSGWGPDDSQPKPLRPGSARVSLADVLKKS